MVVGATSTSLSQLLSSSSSSSSSIPTGPPLFKSKPLSHSINVAAAAAPPTRSSLSFPIVFSSPRTHHHEIPPPPNRIRRISAAPDGFFLLSEANRPEISEEIVNVRDDGVATVIQVLLVIAFIGLSVLTIGVIYIAVADFLQKRESDKFAKEEAAKAKKAGKKERPKLKSKPRGFGQDSEYQKRRK